MRAFKWLMAASAVALVATAAYADAISDRKAIMKDVETSFKVVFPMVRGQAPFDGAKAAEAFTKMSADLAKFPTLFPDNSKSGGDTSAKPTIWEKKADFEAAAKKFSDDAKAAAAESAKGEAAFKAAAANVLKGCGGCHEVYRVSKT